MRQTDPQDFAAAIEADLTKIWEEVRKAEQAEFDESKKREDQKRGHPSFQVGDEVLCERFQLRRGDDNDQGTRKQEFLFDGPFVVKRIIRPEVVELDGLPQGAPNHINVQFLRRYQRDLGSENLRKIPPPPKPTVDATGQPSWEVEKVIGVSGSGRTKKYRIKWKGF